MQTLVVLGPLSRAPILQQMSLRVMEPLVVHGTAVTVLELTQALMEHVAGRISSLKNGTK